VLKSKLYLLVFLWYLFISSKLLSAQVLLGDQNVEATLDSHNIGRAEAFQVTPVTTAALNSLVLYVDQQSSASQISVGLYDDAGGQPSTLLTQATFTPQANAWNMVNVPTVLVNQGSNYWLVVLGLGGGRVYFRTTGNNCNSVGSSPNLTTLPNMWSTQRTYGGCLLSAYGTGAISVSSVSISPNSITLPVNATQQFTATVTGITNPAVSWSATGGSISMTGLYTAAATAGTYTVTATSMVDPTQFSTASVTVTPPVQYSVTLTWNYNTTPTVVGYNVYRASQQNGPYTIINTALIASAAYDDLNVQSGQTYYYVATAVDNNGVESTYSNEAVAVVP